MMKKIILILWLLSIPATVICQNAERSLLEKGNFFSGLSFNFSAKNTDNKDVLVYKIYDQHKDNININLDQGYFIKDHFSLGALINYSSDSRKGTELSTQNILSDIQSRTIGWSVYATMRNYFSLDTSQRFNVFNMIKLGGVVENSLTEKVTSDILERTYMQRRSIELLFYPGLMVQIEKGFAIEVGLEIAGIIIQWTDTEVNGVAGASESLVSADFNINILKLGVGFYYYY